jgi:hypothetical protein
MITTTKPLWRRVRWGNVGRLCALIGAVAALTATARGGGGGPERTAVKRTAVAAPRLAAREGDRGGSPADRGATQGPRSGERPVRQHAGAGADDADVRSGGKAGVRGGAGVSVPIQATSSVRHVLVVHDAVARRPLSTGEFTPDPGPWR